jgi:hypothetical protein
MLAVLLAATLAQLSPIPLSDGGPLGLDDLGLTADGRFLIPEGDLGTVLLLSPDGGRTLLEPPGRGHHTITSALMASEDGGDLLIAGDRTQRDVLVVGEGRIVSFPLAGSPDYVRLAGDRIWVTEPGKEQIEILGLTRRPLTVRELTTVSVPGGPEALVLDVEHGVAYTFSEKRGHLLRFDLASDAETADWPVPCRGEPKGLAVSEGKAFVGCSGGVALTLSLRDGHLISRLAVGEGVDIIAFDRQRRRLYLPASRSADLTIAEVAADGSLKKLRTIATVPRAHCVVEQQGIVLICDPQHGRLLRFDDR